MRPFNGVHFLVTKARTAARVKCNFSGAQEPFWPDALLPESTSD